MSAVLLWLALAGTGAPLSSDAAAFHTELVSTRPAADSVARGAVTALALRFSTAVQPALSTVTMSGPAGPVAELGSVVSGADAAELVVRWAAPLADGAYRVEWRTAGPDGHPIAGAFAFTVADAPAPPAPDTATAAPPGPGIGAEGPRPRSLATDARLPGFVPALVRWLLYATSAGMIGLVAFRWAVLEPLRREPAFALIAFPALRRSWAVGWGVAALALALLPLRLGVQAVALFGTEGLGRTGALLASAWGASWWLEAAAALLLAAGLLLAGAEGRARGWGMVAAGALLMPLVPALSGHAAAAGQLRSFAVLNDALHVAAAGSWIGGLALVLLVGLPAVREADVPTQLSGRLPALAALVAGFSRVALPAVAVLIATGVASAWIQLGSLAALTESAWGRTLLVKLALVAPTLLLGLHHWKRVRPRLDAGAGADQLRAARIEVALALLVLVVTAMLALTPPPGELGGP